MIKFYFHPSPNPAKVALFLEESGLPYELVPVDTRKGEQHDPAFMAINPNAKTPALVDGDAVVFDSNAILLYLAEKTGQFLPANTPEARAQMRDDFDPCDQPDGHHEPPFPSAVDIIYRGLFQHIDGTRRERIVGLEQFSPVHGSGHDEDGRRHVGHDVFRGRQPAHHRHDHIERDDIGPQLLAQLNRPLAIFGLANHFQFRVGGEDVAESATDSERVVDH